MTDDINDLLFELNCNNTKDKQEEAIEKLSKLDDLDLTLLLRPAPYDKQYWENSAKVLFKIGYPKIKNIIPQLFEWIQDMNWPGALLVRDLLLKLPIDVLKPDYDNAVNKAMSEKDEDWLLSLTLFWNDFCIETEKPYNQDFS